MRKLGLLLCLCPSIAWADAEADKGFLVNWLQDNLSGAGRQVRIEGFQGALSSQASLTELTIADDKGIWLRLKDVRLDWSRSALLSGRVEVQSLTAAEIDLTRLPASEASTTPEAGSFALPELPVSVAIQSIQAPLIHLGPDVLGQDVVASLSADLVLDGGAGQTRLDLQRKDAQGHVTLQAAYANGGTLDLALDAAEGAGGIAATKLGVPGAPATGLTIKGSGPLNDFTAQVNLSTEGVTRLGGLVTLKEGAFSALLAGDPTPVFLPAYAEFFGPNVSLQVKGSNSAAGLVLDQMALQTAALTLEGQARIVGGEARFLAVTGRLGLTDGKPVLLPLTTPVSVVSGDLNLFHDAEKGPGWTLSAALEGLTTQTLRAEKVTLTGDGTGAEGAFEVAANGMQASDPALARALGSVATAKARFHKDDAGLALEDLTLTAPGLTLTTLGRFDLDTGFAGKLSGQVDDLSRFSLYRDGLAGLARFDLAGSVQPLTGAFDLQGTINGQDLALGQAEADGLLRGASEARFSARRDTTGLTLRDLTLSAPGITATLAGTLSSTASDLAGKIALPDLSLLGGGRKGSLAGDVAVKGALQDGTLVAKVTGQNLAIGQVEADRLLAGASEVSVSARVTRGAIALESFDLQTGQLTAQASGPIEALTVSARLANLGLFVPEFPGAVTVSGTAGWKDGAVLDLAVKGPGQIAAQVAGRLGSTETNLTARGTAAAALANPFLRPRTVAGGLRFDLALNDLSLAGLSGTVTLTGGRFSDPDLPFGLTGMTTEARLSGGRVALQGASDISTGGRATVSGSVGLSAPYSADLGIGLQAIKLRDPQLYETTVSGDLRFAGPALGGAKVSGALSLGRTELRIPSSLPASAALAGLQHRGDSAAVRATRARAAADEAGAKGASGPAYPLDIRISAPNQVFLRGRGLDAELGGALTLGGTSAEIQPQGGFSLLRGRMDILGRRLTLSEANLDLQGALTPIVHVVASVETSEITASVTVDGPATSPEVTFASSPSLPQEEVLAQLLFGRDLQSISAFQAAQLAGAVATLAGRGGDGLLGKIRSKTGLDNLDIQTDGTGGGSLTAGKYLSEKLYSEVTVDSAGKSEISLNIDVARHITLKAQVDSEGASGAGVFLKKDY